MKTRKITRELQATAAIVALVALGAPAQQARQQVDYVLVPAKPSVRLGEPILISVRVTNLTAQVVQVSRSDTAFGCFEVTDPDGQAVPYVGFDGQVAEAPLQLPPASTVTLADVDLTDKYLVQKPGRYSIRFAEPGTRLSASPAITVDMMPGQMSDFDRIAVRLLRVCPKGWHLAKDARGDVAPFGRSRVEGFTLHLCRNHMQGKAVYLWFTRAEPKVDPNQTPRIKVESLGKALGFYVYAALDKNAPGLWPTAIEDISRALRTGTE